MFTPHFNYTNNLVNDLIWIEKYKTQLEYLYLPTRIHQEMLYKAKMKKTHFSTSIEGNVLSYDQVERVIVKKGKDSKIDAEKEVVNYWEALSFLEDSKNKNRPIDCDFLLELHGIIQRKDRRQKVIGFRLPSPPGVLFAVYDNISRTPEYIPPRSFRY